MCSARNLDPDIGPASAPPLSGFFGQITPAGAFVAVAPAWAARTDARAWTDLVAASDRERVETALTAARRSGAGATLARLAGSEHAVQWHLRGAAAERLDLYLLAPEPSPATARAVAEGTDAGMALIDPDGYLRYANAAYARLHGRPRAALIGHPFTDPLEPGDRAQALADHETVLDGEAGVHQSTYELADGQGGRQSLEIHSKRLPRPEGPVRLATVVDATAQQGQASRLTDATSRLQDLADSMPGWVFRFRSTAAGEYRLDYISEGLHVKAGLAPDQPMAELADWLNYIPPEYHAAYIESIEHSRRTGEPWSHEWPMDVPVGRLWLFGASQPHTYADGSVVWNGLLIDVSPRKAAEQRLEQAEESYRSIFDNTSEGIFRSSRDGALLTANDALVRMHGCTDKADLLARSTDVGAQWYVDPAARADLVARLNRHGCTEDFESQMYRCATGEVFWARENAQAIHDADGEFLYFQGTLRDITAHKREQRLAGSRVEILEMIARGAELTHVLYECVGTLEQYRSRLTAAICHLYDGRMHVEAAPGLGNGCIEAMDGAVPAELGGAVAAALDGNRTAVATESDTIGPGGLAASMEACGYADIAAFPVHDRDGVALGLLLLFVAQRGEIDPEVHTLMSEIGQMSAVAFEQHRLAQRLIEQAQYDPLTQLPNRNRLSDRLQQVMLDAGRGDHPLAVLLLDLDEFKLINDTLGHGAGDRLLLEVASRLQECMRASDTVARFGGDEFVVVAPLRTNADATDVAERVLSALQPPIYLGHREVMARPSIGISLFPQDGLTGDSLLQAADTAMYDAKQAGKNQYSYFAESMNAQVSERLQIEAQLRAALEREELLLYYQPRVSLPEGGIQGAEGLARWQHPERGLLSPGAFLPVAERSTLIGDIDRYVLNSAAAQAAHWHAAGIELLVSLNLSARDLHRDGFGADVAATLERFAAAPAAIELEITESMVMQDVERATRQLRDLKARAPGLRVAIDDFGSGYSSMQYLRQLPIDTLKIDRSFVMDLDTAGAEQTARAIAKTIVELGHNLGLHVIAEGVETQAQADTLYALGCVAAQGFWFHHPYPSDDLEARLL